MTEWGVVGVLVVLVGLFGALIKPIVKLTNTVALNTFATESLTKTMIANESRNKEEHGEIWTELDKHDERISKLEH